MRTRLHLLLFLLCVAGGTQCANAQRVGVRQGNVYYVAANGRSTRLTSGGLDSSPVLSPDGQRVAFVRATPHTIVSAGSGDVQATELYILGMDGKQLSLLVRGKETEKMESLLASFTAPQFSPDGKYLYFLSSAWATSDAVHRVALSDKKSSFVCPGNSLEVIPRGEYTGKLIVQQHRYFLGGGSYDWYWLLKTDGSEVGAIGESTDDFEDLYLKK